MRLPKISKNDSDTKTIMLSSNISVKARLKTSFSYLKQYLNSIYALKLVSGGTRLLYLLNDGSKIPPSLELSQRGITLTIYFSAPNAYYKILNIKRLLSLLAYLKDIYDVELASIYPTIIDVLTALLPKYEEANMDVKQPSRELSYANAALAKELFKLSKQVALLEKENSIYKEFCKAMLERVSANSVDTMMIFTTDFGINKNLIETVAKLCNEKGAMK